MRINPLSLKKKDLQQYMTGYCVHRMPYTQHPNCFDKEILHGDKVFKIGVLDIETFGLGFNANMGIILTYYIKEYGKNKYHSGKIKYKDLRSDILDKNITKNLVKDLKKFDKVITYYGSRFDLPFIRTRALKWRIDFPMYKHIEHKDVYYIIKFKFKFNRNSLEQACKLFHIKGKNHINYEHWIKAVTGNQKSLDYIYTHNKLDVEILEKLFDKVYNFTLNNYKSI